MERKFGIRDKIGYMFGDFGNDFTFIFASSFFNDLLYKSIGDKRSCRWNIIFSSKIYRCSY